MFFWRKALFVLRAIRAIPQQSLTEAAIYKYVTEKKKVAKFHLKVGNIKYGAPQMRVKLNVESNYFE